MAPPCSNWAWVSRAGHKRTHQRPSGHEACDSRTAYNNTLVRGVALVVRLCTTLKVYWCIEQPRSSCMFEFEALAAAIQLCNPHQICVRLASFGSDTCKPLMVVGTAPWLQKLAYLAAARPCRLARHRLTTIGPDGRATGIAQDMAASSVYPPAFCQAISQLHAELVWSQHAKALRALILARRFLGGQLWAVRALQQFL